MINSKIINQFSLWEKMLASSFMYKVYLKKPPNYLLSIFIYFFWDYDLDKISVGRQVT